MDGRRSKTKGSNLFLHKHRIATAAAIACIGATAATATAQEPGYSLALTGPASRPSASPVVLTASGAKPASEFFSSWIDVFAIPVSVLPTCPADHMNALQIADATYAQGGDTVARALEVESAETSFSKPVVYTPRLAGQFLLCGYLNDGLHYDYATASLALNVGGAAADRLRRPAQRRRGSRCPCSNRSRCGRAAHALTCSGSRAWMRARR